MIYIFVALLVLIFILFLWLYRLSSRHLKLRQARKRAIDDPTLPIFDPGPRPTFSTTAQFVADRIMPPTPGPAAPSCYGAHGRRGSVYSGVAVARAHPESESDPDLPAYTEDPSASQRVLVGPECELPSPPTPPPLAHIHGFDRFALAPPYEPPSTKNYRTPPRSMTSLPVNVTMGQV